jgi:hypothetical protein
LSAIIRNYANLEQHGSIIFATELSDFPETPTQNQVVLVEGVLYIYSLVGGLLTWYPLTNKKNSHVHTQAVPATEWSINHNLGTVDFIVGVYDTDNSPMYPSGITDVTNDNFKVTFVEPTAGRLVAFFDSETFVPALNAEAVNAGELQIANGAVVANSTGLYVNGQTVLTANTTDGLDFGTL